MRKPNKWSASPALIFFSPPFSLLSHTPRELQLGRRGARPAPVLPPSRNRAAREHPLPAKYALKTHEQDQQVPRPLSPLFSHPETDRAFKVQKRGAAPSAAHGGWLCKAKNRGQAAETGTSEVPRHAGSGQSPTCHGFAPCRQVASLRPGMRGCGRLGAPADAGMQPARGARCHRSFLGAGCVLLQQ